MPPDQTETQAAAAARLARQLRTVTLIAVVLIVLGVVVLFTLKKLPLPIRMMTGLGDVFIGLVLLVLVRQRRNPR